MKHYITEKGWEFDAHVNFWRNNWSNKANVSKAKHGYRRRERSALKRLVEEQVVAELYGYEEAEAAYEERMLREASDEYDELLAAEVRLRDSGQWDEGWLRLFAAAYHEVNVRRRSYDAA